MDAIISRREALVGLAAFQGGPDKAARLTASGQNAIGRVVWPNREVRVQPAPGSTPHRKLYSAELDGGGKTLARTGAA